MLREPTKRRANMFIALYKDTRDMICFSADVEGDEFEDRCSTMQYHRGASY